MNPAIRLSPYRPSREVPWDRNSASHLLGRAGFAPSESEIQATIQAGPEATVDRLITGRTDSPRHDELDALGDRLAAQDDIEALRGWWLLRQSHTIRPLHARMALFWHDHFATNNAKVRSPALMYRQLRTFERLALGNFGEMVRAVSRDPAMIVWLDGNLNVKGRPNENYARELFELFTLGVGNYTERDIKESARAFTGWHQKQGRFHFNRLSHDAGPKAVLGRTGPLDGDDVIEAALAQAACARFIATKLLREFLCPEPPEALVDALAGVLRDSDYDLSLTVRTLLGSQAMFDPGWRRSRIKSPVEFVVGIVRSLELSIGAGDLSAAVSQMGQALFEPPSVKGWDDHRAWLNSASMLVRLNAAVTATSEDMLDPDRLIARYSLDGTQAIIRFCARLAFGTQVPAALERQLRAIDAEPARAMREALRLLLTSPEYQFI